MSITPKAGWYQCLKAEGIGLWGTPTQDGDDLWIPVAWGDPVVRSQTLETGTAVIPTAPETATNARELKICPILTRKGWSTLDWAKESKVDPKTAASYLKGKTDPFPYTRKKLAESLGIDVQDLP
jgi:hypothetical protein